MGLTIRLGCSAAELKTINDILDAEGVDDDGVALVASPPKSAVPRTILDSFPYSFLHYLRRAYAKVEKGVELTEVEEGEDPAEDPDVQALVPLLDCHLVLHSDSDGFYVPLEFSEPIMDRETRLTIGSSVQLLEELALVAPALDIRLVDGKLSRVEARRHADLDEDAPFFRERLVWMALDAFSRASIEHHTVIRFD